MAEPLLVVRDLVKHYRRGRRRVHAVNGVSFDLERGESLGLVGESGCGKTTTARVILGLQRATSGSIRYGGVELTTLSERDWQPLRRNLQVIFQDPSASLDPRQSVASILAEPMKIHRLGKPKERRVRAHSLVEAVGLSPQHLERFPHELSGGQRQRVAIARALALEPELIVCDEPLSALDVSIQAQIANLLRELQERYALAYLFISHDLAVVYRLCRRVAVMYAGRIVETADSAPLFAAPIHPYTQALLSAIPQPDPDHEARRQRIVLSGEVPDPAFPPPGCPFHPRCPRKDEVPDGRCSRELPELCPRVPLAGARGRMLACHLASEAAGDALPAGPTG